MSSNNDIDFDAWREDIKQEGSVKVGGETVKDYEKGVKTEGPVDGTDPTSIYDANPENLVAAGLDDSGDPNTEATVTDFVNNRNMNLPTNQSGAGGATTTTTSDGPGGSLGLPNFGGPAPVLIAALVAAYVLLS
jgi:hypothetical protein